jgi:hypothetical protein
MKSQKRNFGMILKKTASALSNNKLLLSAILYPRNEHTTATLFRAQNIECETKLETPAMFMSRVG